MPKKNLSLFAPSSLKVVFKKERRGCSEREITHAREREKRKKEKNGHFSEKKKKKYYISLPHFLQSHALFAHSLFLRVSE